MYAELSPENIFFYGYREDKTIELWYATIRENNQIPVYAEPAKYPFHLLPREEQFFMGYCKQISECSDIGLDEMPSRYWWGDLYLSPERDMILWTETVEFCPPHLGYCQGGATRIAVFETATFDKRTIAEVTYHASLLTYRTISTVRWSPNNQSISYIESSKNAGWSRLKIVDINSFAKKNNVVEDVYDYKWSPRGNRIAYIDFSQNIKVIDKHGELLFGTMDDFKRVTDFAWSPDENSLVFSAIMPQGESRVYIVDLPSQKVRVLYEGTDGTVYTGVKWSPRKTEIVVIQRLGAEQSGQMFFVKDLKKPSPEFVKKEILVELDKTGKAAGWEWSPNGTVIAVQTISRDSQGNTEIAFVDVDKGEILSNFISSTHQTEWMFFENSDALLVLQRSQDTECPKSNIDTIGVFYWYNNLFSKLNLNPLLENDLKACKFSISHAIAGD